MCSLLWQPCLDEMCMCHGILHIRKSSRCIVYFGVLQGQLTGLASGCLEACGACEASRGSEVTIYCRISEISNCLVFYW